MGCFLRGLELGAERVVDWEDEWCVMGEIMGVNAVGRWNWVGITSGILDGRGG